MQCWQLDSARLAVIMGFGFYVLGIKGTDTDSL